MIWAVWNYTKTKTSEPKKLVLERKTIGTVRRLDKSNRSLWMAEEQTIKITLAYNMKTSNQMSQTPQFRIYARHACIEDKKNTDD